jgi:hypothetical protein
MSKPRAEVAEVETQSSAAVMDPPRVPVVGDIVHLHCRGIRMHAPSKDHRARTGALVVTSSPVKVTRVASPGDPESMLDVEREFTNTYQHCMYARNWHERGKPSDFRGQWAALGGEASGGGWPEPALDPPPHCPGKGDPCVYFGPDETGRVVPIRSIITSDTDDTDWVADIEIPGREILANVRFGGVDAAGHGEWSWTPAKE